jgi:phage terminase large subunit
LAEANPRQLQEKNPQEIPETLCLTAPAVLPKTYDENGVVERTPLDDFIDRYYHEPVLMVREVFGKEPMPYQIDAMGAVARGERAISMRSGHGVGKTTTLSWIIIWFMLTRFPQKTVCTAPTTGQLYDALMAETRGWIQELPEALQVLFEVKAEGIELRASPDKSFVSFRTSRPETPEALAGIHSDNVLLIADEASGIAEQVFVAARGSMSGHNATTILAGNPVRSQGLFFDTHRKPETMKRWYRIHVSCLDTPLVAKVYAQEMAEQYGEDSNVYRVRVLGEFPLADDDTVIPLELADAALNRDVKPIDVKPIWGLDVARFGNDRTSLAKRKGNVLLEKVRSWRNLDTMETVGRVKVEYDATPDKEKPLYICVDVIGLGAGVVDRLRELGLPVRGINVSESPALTEQYKNLRAELWHGKARPWFLKRDCNLAGDTDLSGELTKVRYKITSNGKIQIESKEEMKKRGQPSPDPGDAFVLTFAADASTAMGGNDKHRDWKKPLKRALGLV